MSLLKNIFRPSLNKAVILSFILGIICGKLIQIYIHDAFILKNITQQLENISNTFIKLLKIFIAPMVFCVLIDSLSIIKDGKKFGIIFLKVILIFSIAGLLALSIGVVMEHLLNTGATLQNALQATLPKISDKADLCNNCSILDNFLPKSIISGFLDNNTLQVVLLAMLFGVAALSIKQQESAYFFKFMNSSAKILAKITTYILLLAPLAVFASVCHATISLGFDSINTYLIYFVHFISALGVLISIILFIGIIILGKDLFKLITRISYLLFMSFSASSSQISLSGLILELEEMGVKKELNYFATPLSFIFNQLAGMMNCTFATLFIIHLYGFSTTISQEIIIILLFFVTSKAMVGIPRASSIIIASTLSALGYPEAGILILFPIDGILDMLRSAINVLGNAITIMITNKLIQV